MHLKKFAVFYLLLLGIGLLILSYQDILFVAGAESQVAKVTHHVEGKTETYYKLGGSYQEKTLRPAIEYAVNDKTLTHVPEYSCKEGCHPVGTSVTIFYQKDRPEVVKVSTFGGMWKYKIYFLIVMGVLLVTALPYLYVNRPRES